MNKHDMASVSIRQKAAEFRNQFRLLVEVEDEVQRTDAAELLERNDERTRMQDQMARFDLWAGNIGVFADGHASLEYRVKIDSRKTRTWPFCVIEHNGFLC